MSGRNYGGILISVAVLLGYLTKTNGEVCGSITLKSPRASDYDHLQNCTIIEGNVGVFLGIGNFGSMNDNISMDLSFPNIVEITDYLLVFKANRLESLSQLFPNLFVIRGHELLGDHALSILENENLRDVGLTSLTTILRGGVVIKHNPMLCYVDMIDWRRIVSFDYHDHIDAQEVFDSGICPYKCPLECPFQATPHGKFQFCWNLEHCQRQELDNCSSNNQTCFYNSNGSIENCAKECLGGCDIGITKPSNGNCRSCRNVRIGNICQSSCPQGTLLLKDYRCVNDEECNTKYDSNGLERPFKPFRGQCLSKCPEHTKEKNGTCVTCSEDCPTECPGGNITSTDALATFVGCTVIKGSLSIQLKGRNIVQKLEEALSKVKVIEGSLKISRVFSLMSLDVFKSLEVIEGQNLEENFSLTLLENENLKKMFPQREHGRRVQIYRTFNNGTRVPGRAFINYNPHLCLEEIESVLGSALHDSQISNKTNGNKAQCNPMLLEVNATVAISQFGIPQIKLEFKSYLETIWELNNENDLRVLKTYVVHYKQLEPATFRAQNLTKYRDRDICLESCSDSVGQAPSDSSGTNNLPCDKTTWQVSEFEPRGSIVVSDESQNPVITWPNETLEISNVEPYTYYGLFVTTMLVREYMVNQNVSGAESEIIYIQAPVYYPSKPEAVSIVSINHTTFNIMWEPPLSPNGEIDHYELILELRQDGLVLERNGNFCDKQFENGFFVSNPDKKSDSSTSDTNKENSSLPEDDIQKQPCACSSYQCQQSDNQAVQGPITEENRISEDIFLTLVINSAFQNTRNDSGSRAKRSIRNEVDEPIPTTKDNLVPEVHDQIGSSSSWTKIASKLQDNAYTVFSIVVPSQRNSFQATHLQHFGQYLVKLRACHAPKSIDDKLVKWCSVPVLQSPLVYPKPEADDIPESSFHYLSNNGSNPTWLIWDPPKDPNGHILSYTIRYKSEENGTEVSRSCISATQYEKFGNRYPMPMKESYFVSVRAISLSAPGNWTRFIWVEQPSENRSIAWFIIAPITAVFLLMALIFAFLYFRWVQEQQRKSTFSTQNPNYCPMEYIADEWEIKRTLVVVGEKIGKGAFAVVHKGTYLSPNGGTTEIAIKMPHEDAQHMECMQFLQEAHLMKEIKAVHVVRLIGVVSVNLPYMVLLEYMALGDLRTYLTTHRPNSEFNLTNKPPPTIKRMYQMALEIADGMAYLANQSKSVVHRDLAARNCLVSADGIVKIADFGMARQVYDNYQKHGQGKMPVRWMSPEALRGEFSTKTDVWSYGVVLWEIVTLGDLPYPGLSHNEVMQFVDHQRIMAKPNSCPDHLYDLMKRCWHRHLSRRPTFLDIAQELLPWASDRFLRESYVTSSEGKSAFEAQIKLDPVEETVPAETFEDQVAEECLPLTQNGGSPRTQSFSQDAGANSKDLSLGASSLVSKLSWAPSLFSMVKRQQSDSITG